MSETAERLLDLAQQLVQQRGFNAFSFRDLAKPLGITNAGIHYHFSTKSELGRALIARYRRTFMAALAEVKARGGAPLDDLNGFVEIYARTLKSGRFCLCGMLASDALTLPEEVLQEVKLFFTQVEDWLAQVLNLGRDDASIQFDGNASDEAALILATVEGAMLTAWPIRAIDAERALKQFRQVSYRLLGQLASTTE